MLFYILQSSLSLFSVCLDQWWNSRLGADVGIFSWLGAAPLARSRGYRRSLDLRWCGSRLALVSRHLFPVVGPTLDLFLNVAFFVERSKYHDFLVF